MNKKWIIYIAIGLIVFITFICFASEIQVWMMSKLTELLVLLIAFAAGWFLGRFGGRRRRDDDRQNVRNTTEAQK
ncbi:MAG: hypothetical protein RR410_00975 [Alistipes sp.]